MLQNYLRKCKDAYFVRWNKCLCIYKDTFKQRHLGMIAHWIYGIILALFGAFSAMWHFLWMGCHGFFLKATMGILLKSAFGKRDKEPISSSRNNILEDLLKYPIVFDMFNVIV